MPITSSNPITHSLAAAIALANGYNVTGSIPNITNNPGLLQNGNVGFGVDSQGHTIYGTSEIGMIALQAQAKHILNGDSKTFSYGPNQTPLSAIGAILAPNDPTWVKNVAASLGVNLSTKLGAIASGSTPVTSALQILSPNKLTFQGTIAGWPQGDPGSTGGTGDASQVTNLGFNVPAATPLAAPTNISGTATNEASAVSLNLEVTDSTMSQTPWYQDQNLITGNQRVRNSMGSTSNGGLVLPVSFRVYLSKSTNSLLVNPSTQKPITMNLNASMSQWSVLSRHVFTRTPTRTGMHVTFWGMAADTIQGTATTGVFMNAFGVTDYFSTAKPTDDMLATVQRALAKDPQAQKQIAANPEAYRVAAQDGFVEFLKLFQMNGNVWFNSTPASPTQANQSQTAPNVWQISTGATTFQQNAETTTCGQRGTS